MKINFTKKEYRTLVEMLLVADWVINAHEVAEGEGVRKPYKELRKKVLSHHKEMGMEEEFSYSEELDNYYESKEYEDRAPHMRFVDEHDESVFWDELARRLAHRDLHAEETLRPEGPYEGEERMMRVFEIAGRYEDELIEHGLENIRLVVDADQVH
jgi:hypothetical protein